MYESREFILETIHAGYKSLERSVTAFWFENPVSGLRYFTGEELLFKGWILPFSETSFCWVVRKEGVVQAELLPTETRLDVVEKFNVDRGRSAKLGFQFQLSGAEFDRLGVRLNGVEYEIWNAVPLGDPYLVDGEVGRASHGQSTPSGLKEYQANLNDRKPTPTDFTITDSIEFIKSFSHAFDRSRVKSTIERISSPDWPIGFILEGLDGNGFGSPGIYFDEPLVCRYSLMVSDFNFIYFSNGKESYYIVQHCTNVSIVIPDKRLIVGLAWGVDWARLTAHKLPQLYIESEKFARQADYFFEGEFLGLCLSHSRPYHYFYDYLFGFNLLCSRTGGAFDVYGIEGQDFFNVADLEYCKSYVGMSHEKLNSYCQERGGFLVSPCVQYVASEFDRGMHDLSMRLRSVANRQPYGAHVEFDVSGSEMVVWVGVSDEKRRWVEQQEGLVSIFSELQKKYKNVTVFVDGRTFPLTPGPSDFRNKKREDVLFEALTKQCKGIRFVNLIGLTAMQKIFLAQKIDIFISNFATDSMYPSAICRKPGVVYSSSTIGSDRGLHVHHAIVEVPSERIREISSEDGVQKVWHETSISMDWRDVYECVKRITDHRFPGGWVIPPQKRCVQK